AFSTDHNSAHPSRPRNQPKRTGRRWQFTPGEGGPVVTCKAHGYVNVLKELAGRKATHAVGGFHQIVTRLTAMFATESVDEQERFRKLSGPDQETRAIDLPLSDHLTHVRPPLGEGGWIDCWIYELRLSNLQSK